MNTPFQLGIHPFGLAQLMQDSTGDLESTLKSEVVSLAKFLEKGGIVMYPLIALSVIAVILIFYYLLTLRRNAVVSDAFMKAAEAHLRNHDYLGLVALCSRKNQSIARVTEKTLDFMTQNPGASFSVIREVAEAEGSRQAGLLSQRIAYLSDIGNVAPMIGLLGTVIGMIKAFSAMGVSLNVKQTTLLANSVSEALITTASGLVIGIVAVLFYSWFRGKVMRYIAELEAAATHLTALLAAQLNQKARTEKKHRNPVQEKPATAY